jgi:uncharacterized SAM-dependent methyltransferase
MEREATASRIEVEVRYNGSGGADMAHEVRRGLTARPKELPPKYFYDERGSRLFEQITGLPEYYPTRAERGILANRSAEIVSAAGEPGTLVELGSGSADKTRHLLSAMEEAGCLEVYAPVDISEEITRATAEALVGEYGSSTTSSEFRRAVAAASSFSSAGRSAISTPSRGQSSWPGSRPCWGRRTGCCLAPTW